MFEKDAKDVIRRFKSIMDRARNRKEHLSVTLSQLYLLDEDVDNLFHEDDLKE